jgi:GNAT superfamily N-acetyltransferase
MSVLIEHPPLFGMVPQIRPVRHEDQAEWLRMRALLWPDCIAEQHAHEITAFLESEACGWSEPFLAVATFVAVRPGGGLCGFLEASLRPYVEDCITWPVGYVEGWFVDSDVRRQGIGSRLIAISEQWATAQGCREMASDAQIENRVSLAAHQALGFEESSRAVHLRKWLTEAKNHAAGPSTAHQLTLVMLEDTFAVCRLSSDAAVPPWASAGGFFSITRTADELSIVCKEQAVPDGVRTEKGWRCLRAAGSIPFSAIGVLRSLVTPLAEAGTSVFAVSTFDTDYLLVMEKDIHKAVAALRQHGHEVR